jgi:hypothetical protein
MNWKNRTGNNKQQRTQKFVVAEVEFGYIGVKLSKFHGCRMPMVEIEWK